MVIANKTLIICTNNDLCGAKMSVQAGMRNELQQNVSAKAREDQAHYGLEEISFALSSFLYNCLP